MFDYTEEHVLRTQQGAPAEVAMKESGTCTWTQRCTQKTDLPYLADKRQPRGNSERKWDGGGGT